MSVRLAKLILQFGRTDKMLYASNIPRNRRNIPEIPILHSSSFFIPTFWNKISTNSLVGGSSNEKRSTYHINFQFQLVKRDPGVLGIRCWSQYGMLYMRHFNELDHELQARLNRAYKPAVKYMESFSSAMGAVIARYSQQL